jgi:predicted metal-dependent hydrolase
MHVKIIRSDRRRKTVSARPVGDVLEVYAPAEIGDAELEPIIARLRQRVERQQTRRALDDGDLARIAERFNQQYFAGKLRWRALTWVANQEQRFGSCTPANQTIRISHRLATMPRFVLEYVVMHELAHLVEANHGPNFWKLVNRYPRTERARGYLMAVGMEELDTDDEVAR